MARELTIRIQIADSQQARAALDSVEQGLQNVEKAGGKVASTVGDEKKEGSLNAGLMTLGKVMAAVGAADAVRRVVDYGSKLEDLALKTGIGVIALQKLDFVGKLVGVSLEQTASGVTMLQNRLAGGDKGAIAALNELGLSLDEILRMSPDQMFLKVGAAVAAIPDPAKRTETAMDLLGRAGANLLPVLLTVNQEFERAPTVAEDAVKGLDRAGDAWTRLTTVVSTAVGTLLGGMFDAFDALQAKAESWGVDFISVIQKVILGIGTMVGHFINAKNAIVGFAEGTYTGVKTWLFDKFSAVVDGVKGSIEKIEAAFAWLKDKVVGHSHIPDMVIAIGQWAQRLQPLMVEPIVRSTQMVESTFSNMLRNVTNMFNKFGNSIGGAITSSIGGPIGSALGGVASGMVSALGDIVTGGITALINLAVGLVMKGLAKVKQLLQGNVTDEARTDFARGLGFNSLDALYNLLGTLGPEGERLRQVAMELIGKHDIERNEQWMSMVSSLLQSRGLMDFFGLLPGTGIDLGTPPIRHSQTQPVTPGMRGHGVGTTVNNYSISAIDAGSFAQWSQQPDIASSFWNATTQAARLARGSA